MTTPGPPSYETGTGPMARVTSRPGHRDRSRRSWLATTMGARPGAQGLLQLVAEPGRAGVGFVDAGQDPQQSRLAGAVLADRADPVAGRGGQGDTVEHPERAPDAKEVMGDERGPNRRGEPRSTKIRAHTMGPAWAGHDDRGRGDSAIMRPSVAGTGSHPKMSSSPATSAPIFGNSRQGLAHRQRHRCQLPPMLDELLSDEFPGREVYRPASRPARARRPSAPMIVSSRTAKSTIPPPSTAKVIPTDMLHRPSTHGRYGRVNRS